MKLKDAIQQYKDAIIAKNSSSNTIEAQVKSKQKELDSFAKTLKLKGFSLNSQKSYNSTIVFMYDGLKDITYGFDYDTYAFSTRKQASTTIEEFIENKITIKVDKVSFGTIPHQYSGYSKISELEKSAKEAGVSTFTQYAQNGAKAWNAYAEFVEQLKNQKEYFQKLKTISDEISNLYDDTSSKEITIQLNAHIDSAKSDVIASLKGEILDIFKKGWSVKPIAYSQFTENAKKYADVFALLGLSTYQISETIGYEDLKRNYSNLAVFPLFWNKSENESVQAESIKLTKQNTKSVKVSITEPKKGTSVIDKEHMSRNNNENSIKVYTDFGRTSYSSSRGSDYVTLSQGNKIDSLTTENRLMQIFLAYEPSAIKDIDQLLQLSSN